MRANKLNTARSIQNISIYLIKWIQTKLNCSNEIALQKLMTTLTYEALLDENTKLFSESKEYVLDMLISELKNDMDNWMKI